jgi:ADP-dependent NAD(P)H-hydrate dehydratase / NAD(P)H-hydrate epimerase
MIPLVGMKLLTAQQIKAWDAYTIKHGGITAVELMERAATLCADKLSARLLDTSVKQAFVFCGGGNNGGDGLVIARKLAEQGVAVYVYFLRSTFQSPANKYNEGLLPKDIIVRDLHSEKDIPEIGEQLLVVDALLGTGMNRAPSDLMASVIDHINQSKALVVAVDIPSGLPAEVTDLEDLRNRSIVRADTTYTFQLPKLSFTHTECFEFTGTVEVIDIGLLASYLNTVNATVELITAEHMLERYLPRTQFGHKGIFGHTLMVSGSYGKLGAAILSSKAALRVGSGLVTTFVPKVGFTVLQTALPEVMVATDDELFEIRNFPDTERYDAVGVGPGIGTSEPTEKGFVKWLKHISQPIVIDADGLNLCAAILQKEKDFRFPDRCILTPHPKEFDRLVGPSHSSFEREQKLKAFVQKHQVVVVLKGAYSRIACPDGKLYYNGSGNVALATAGSGDVLTGIITGLLAQQYSTVDAAIIGVYLHGVCADMWVQQQHQTMIAGDIVEMIPKALYRIFA